MTKKTKKTKKKPYQAVLQKMLKKKMDPALLTKKGVVMYFECHNKRGKTEAQDLLRDVYSKNPETIKSDYRQQKTGII
jgi:hypothetical protein